MKNEAAVELGKLSHKRQSKEQSAASRLNGTLGGRPRIKSFDKPARSIVEVNRAIKHLGLAVYRTRSCNWCFIHIVNQEKVADLFWSGKINGMTLAQWLTAAGEALVLLHKQK